MSGSTLDLSTEAARWIRELLIPDSENEAQLLVLLRGGRAVQAVRTDRGPLREYPQDIASHGLSRARQLAGPPDVERLVTVELVNGSPPSTTLGGLLDGTIRTDPPSVPALDRFLSLSPAARRWLLRMIPDGAYGLTIEDANLALSARVRSGRLELLRGAEAVEPESLDTQLRRRVGRPQLALASGQRTVCAILESRRPVTALDRAMIRGEVQVAVSSLRVRLLLFLLRLLGR